MNRDALKVFFTLIYILLFTSCSQEKTAEVSRDYLTDDLYNKFHISKPPQKIITLSPNLTELVFELGLGNKIVGNTSFCNFPDSAKKIPDVADLLTVNLEKISSLNPDLIFISAEGNSKSQYDKLIDLNYKVFVSNPRNYKGIKKTLLDIGKIFNITEKAKGIIQNWDSRLNKIRNGKDKILLNSVMFLVSTKPVISIGKNSFINEIITFTGLKNISANSEVNYPFFSREEILLRNPDYILLFETNENNVNSLLRLYPEWNILSAVVNNRVLFLNADLFSRPGPRFIDAVEELHKIITE